MTAVAGEFRRDGDRQAADVAGLMRRCPPLFLLLFSGLYMFVLPYARRQHA